MPAKKRVAAIVTEYRRHSHADVILGKILNGYYLERRKFPNLQLTAMVVDQSPPGDMSRDLARKHGFRICRTAAEAILDANGKLAVDGVLCIGEHGNYPKNNRGQILYPRRRFFEETAAAFEKAGSSVPVFTDKHLAATWADAKWMYDKARELFIPLMAGSSIPFCWRKPELNLPMGCELESAVQIGYGPFEGYGFHALEGLQCMVERRRGGEVGVAAVTCLQGESMWESLDRGGWSKPVLDAALQRVPSHATGDIRKLTEKDSEAAVCLIEYGDGFRAAVAMLNGWIYEGDGGAFCFGAQVRGETKPVSTQFYMQQPDPFAHFSHQLMAIDRMIQSTHAPFPVERTLLTTGVLDAIMISKAEKGRRVTTPHLSIAYKPVEHPHATGAIPRAKPN